MEDVDMEAAPPTADEFSAVVISHFSNSENQHHRHVCTAIGVMTEELKRQNLPLTPVAYFGFACSSLDHLSSSPDPAGHHLDALLTILSLVVDRISPAVLKTKHIHLSELLIRILRVKSVGVDGVLPGMKCASRLLIVRKNVGWTDVAELYGVLISYITDDRLKVRKQSHSCLREVLRYFNSSQSLTTLLESASEAITNVFERFLRLAGVSNPVASKGPKAAQQVLYVLDALKVSLPYMSGQSANILNYFKSLLMLRHPVVTKCITDCLNALCLHSTGEISAQSLLDLLLSLATSLSRNESSADSMAFTARSLDTGMKRVYSLNRQICVVGLPVIFKGLKDILASGHEEALVAAVSTFNSLINSCIDEGLITQGVDQITTSDHEAARKPSPSIIEDVCVITESLLDYQYKAVWHMSFQIVSTMFEKLGEHSSNLLKGTLESLADMQKFIPDEGFALRKQLHECIGTALGSMGPETFLSILPLKLDLQDPSEGNLWLFPILKQYTIGAHLNFFTRSILPKIREMKEKSALLEQQGKLYSSRIAEGIVYSLWSLLPSFCNYPVDTAESFKPLETPLSTALREEADVRGIICASLHILIQQNKGILEGIVERPSTEAGIARERAIALYNADVALSNLSTLKSSAPELLKVLTELCFKSSKDTVGILQSTIGELASISDKRVITRCFKRIMHFFLKITREAGKSVNSEDPNSMQVDNLPFEGPLPTYRAQLLDLAASLLPCLDSEQIDKLYDVIQPALEDTDGLIQKKAYRVLSLIFQKFDDFISRKLKKVLHLMTNVLPSCHISAIPHRLNCIGFLIIHVFKEGLEQELHESTVSILAEIILALKEANKRTRNSAFEILIQIGHACGDEKQGGEEKLQKFFCMVVGGQSGVTRRMISAATTALARLVYEFPDLVSLAYKFLSSSKLPPHNRKNKEIIKANLGLLKVLVVKSPADCVHTHLPDMVEELLHWKDGTRDNFNTKVKHLLEMLVQKCGLDAVKKVIPEKHMNLLTYLEKLNKRKERKRSATSVEDRSIVSKATTSRISKWNYTRIFSDFEDDETRNSDGEFTDERSISSRWSKYTSGVQSKPFLLRTKRTHKQTKSLQEHSFDQLEDEPVDLLNRQKTRSALLSSLQVKRKPNSDDELEIDSEGRLIILEDGKIEKSNRKNKQDLRSDNEYEGRSQTGSHLSESSRKTQKRRKTSESGWAYTGKEYTSKKASGDVTRKDKLEPYAYWPLDRKMVSRRPEQRAAARKGMASVVKLTKRLEGKSVSNALSVKGVMLKRCKKIGKR